MTPMTTFEIILEALIKSGPCNIYKLLDECKWNVPTDMADFVLIIMYNEGLIGRTEADSPVYSITDRGRKYLALERP